MLGLSRREVMVGAAGLALAGPARARPRIEEAAFRVRDFAVIRFRADDTRGRPVLLWLPVVSGPCAPIHLSLARRLAVVGYHVLTPALPERSASDERARDIADTLALGAREGASRSRFGVVGYDGGGIAAHAALTADARIRAGVVYPGPLMASAISRPEAVPATDARLLEHPGCADIGAAEAALASGLAWLAAHGVA